jgi:hypothetical protein
MRSIRRKPRDYLRADQRFDIPGPVHGFSRCASVARCGLESDGLPGVLFDMRQPRGARRLLAARCVENRPASIFAFIFSASSSSLADKAERCASMRIAALARDPSAKGKRGVPRFQKARS